MLLLCVCVVGGAVYARRCRIFMSTTNPLQAAHAVLAEAARSAGCTASKLVGSVSRHTLPSTASFANLSVLHSKAQAGALVANGATPGVVLSHRTFLATSGTALIFSARFDQAVTKERLGTESDVTPQTSQQSQPLATPPPPPPPVVLPPRPSTGSGKRKRQLCEDQEDAVSRARKRLSSASAPELQSELETAQVVIEKALGLRGPAGEVLVQSYALLTRKLKPTDVQPSVVVAMRLNSGLAVPISALKRCLGSCWVDGVVSSERAVSGVCDRDLPLTEEGAASMAMGNLPLLVVTSVPKPASPPRGEATTV